MTRHRLPKRPPTKTQDWIADLGLLLVAFLMGIGCGVVLNETTVKRWTADATPTVYQVRIDRTTNGPVDERLLWWRLHCEATPGECS